jgi:multimeric flavodoxin WrbA
MKKILAIYGSPRRKGNTAALLDRAVQGALETGAEVEKLFSSRFRNIPMH